VKVLGIDHIGIAVEDINKAVLMYEKTLGVKAEEIFVGRTGTMKGSYVPIGKNGRIELVQPTSPDSRTSRLVAEKGYGLVHLAIEVADLDQAVEELRAAGIKFMDEKPAPSSSRRRLIFTDPKSLGGVSIEFVGT
jgi:methylmalonyl-CoA epimerase